MVPSDVEIAQSHELRPITEIAETAGIPPDALIPHGGDMAKIDVARLGERPADGDVVLVTGMSPTPAGEGKSTVLIGLVDALRLRGRNAAAALREPSLGPVMGLKGGAAGGGRSQVVPMERVNLHFTGDFHAVTAADNTLAALVANHVHQGNELRIDPRRVSWQRCLDVNDRELRHVVTGLGGPGSGTPAETGFTITAASEIMAILCLATDLADLRRRLAAITVGLDVDGAPVTAGDLRAEGALTVLLKDALNPNLVQTLGGAPAFIHGGPFANIAHGCNSILATTTARRCADIVVTEAGFGSDLGAEKFLDIKARAGNLDVACAVIVATIRSLKHNGGADANAGEDRAALERGLPNLERHVANLRLFGVTPVVALNLFDSDTTRERRLAARWAEEHGVELREVTVHGDGGAGALDLADAVLAAAGSGSHPLYDPAEGVRAAIDVIARRIYHADHVAYSSHAERDLATLAEHGWDRLPVCISKTPYSFSDDPGALGAPEGHVLHVRRLLPRTGAGFVVALTGSVMTMPGLPRHPAAERIDVDAGGNVTGLS